MFTVVKDDKKVPKVSEVRWLGGVDNEDDVLGAVHILLRYYIGGVIKIYYNIT